MKNMYGKELVFPEDVYYSEELLWVKPQGGNRVRVGISDLGVKSVKDLVFVKINPRPGTQVAKGELLGHVETTKGVWEIIAPLAGTLVEVNPPVTKGIANQIVHAPYGEGWLVELATAGDPGNALTALLKGSEATTKQWIIEKAKEVVPGADDEDEDD